METISIIEPVGEKEDNWSPVVGENTTALLSKITNIDDAEKVRIKNEAIEILSHCHKPGRRGRITNIAVGYVQSGKTLSFTILSALAVDNGFAMIIYLAGSKNNLLAQTQQRLKEALQNLNSGGRGIKFFGEQEFTAPGISTILGREKGDYAALLPILKNAKHVDNVVSVISDSIVSGLLESKSVLIIDDEADQASLNTCARKNSSREWDKDELSAIYSSINKLKEALPCHSYVQYTATPQAPLLIESQDILSPKYYTVLTPGGGYTGGKFFLGDDAGYTVVIPEDEIYNKKTKNVFDEIPHSLEDALLKFFVSVAVVVKLQKRIAFLSMMVHIDGQRETNIKFKDWVDCWIGKWQGVLSNCKPGQVGFEENREIVRAAYKEVVNKMDAGKLPLFDDVWRELDHVLIECKAYLVQPADSKGKGQTEILWNEAPAHVLVGGDMLNRGFTVENLSMTYLQRCGKATNNADTLEQRARFFGYKLKYSDVVRIFMSQKLINLFRDYVLHEEDFRKAMLDCKSRKVCDLARAFRMDNKSMRPTRTNVLSRDLFKIRMSGWHQMTSTVQLGMNKEVVESFCKKISGWSDFDDNSKRRNNLRAIVPIKDFCDFWRDFEYEDYPNKMRKVCTINSLLYLLEKGAMENVQVIKMSNLEPCERGLNPNGDIKNLQSGASGSFHGDKSLKSENEVTIQIYNVKIKNPGHANHGKCVYNLAVYYPETFATTYISLDESENDFLSDDY